MGWPERCTRTEGLLWVRARLAAAGRGFGGTGRPVAGAFAQGARDQKAMTSDQQRLAGDLIARVGRCVHLKERHGGHGVCMPGSRQPGRVRFNIGGRDRGRYSVYAPHPFSDPRGRFQNRTRDRSDRGLRCVVDPGNAEAVRYVIGVLESSYGMKRDRVSQARITAFRAGPGPRAMSQEGRAGRPDATPTAIRVTPGGSEGPDFCP